MAKPLSEDLRVRVVRAVEDGMSRRAAAERFGISAAGGTQAHSACTAFGLERIVLALFAEHGLDPDRWPHAVDVSVIKRVAEGAAAMVRALVD